MKIYCIFFDLSMIYFTRADDLNCLTKLKFLGSWEIAFKSLDVLLIGAALPLYFDALFLKSSSDWTFFKLALCVVVRGTYRLTLS